MHHQSEQDITDLHLSASWPLALKEDAFQHSWNHLRVYAFSLLAMTCKVINHARPSTSLKTILEVPP